MRSCGTKAAETGQAFPTTQWILVEAARVNDRDQAAIGILLQRYWKPVYFYLRRRGHDHEHAKDLTQGFFHEIVLKRHLLDKADRAKGRFRSFLLLALDRYAADVQKQQARQKRAPLGKLVPLDMVGPLDLPAWVATSTPEEAFHYAWIADLLEQALVQVEAQCHKDAMTVHWYAFRDRVLRPILDRTAPPSLKEICGRHGIESETKATNMIVTVKRRLQSTLWQHIRNSVDSDEWVKTELEDIRELFPTIMRAPT